MDELKSTGLKTTIPRQKILEIFQKGVQRHMTAEDVFKHLLNDNADIGLATVYRVLTQFEQAGLLSRNHFESGKAVYELNEGQHHDHMVCLDCARHWPGAIGDPHPQFVLRSFRSKAPHQQGHID